MSFVDEANPERHGSTRLADGNDRPGQLRKSGNGRVLSLVCREILFCRRSDRMEVVFQWLALSLGQVFERSGDLLGNWKMNQ